MKKGSIGLSVNAIVVLVMAMVMLGLGLGFINGMFGKMSSSFEEQAAQEEVTPASASNPLTLSKERIIVEAGEDVVMKGSAYNIFEDPDDINITTSCGDLFDSFSSSGEKSLDSQEVAEYIFVFKNAKSGRKGINICGFESEGSTNGKIDSKDVTVEIR